MCLAGLYFVFLLLEDVIVSYYSTDAASQDQEQNVEAAFEMFKKDVLAKSLSKDISKQSKNGHAFRFTINITTTPGHSHKKRHVSRVTGKQYEIINMLWRKTRIFSDEKYTPAPTHRANATKLLKKRYTEGGPNIFSAFAIGSQPTTPSKIEFYYLDDIRETPKNTCREPNCNNNIKPTNNYKKAKIKSSSNPSLFVFHLKAPYMKPAINSPVYISGMQIEKPEKITHYIKKDQSSKESKVNEIPVKTLITSIPRKEFFFDKATTNSIKSTTLNNKTQSSQTVVKIESTTMYDKIKFFEMYDQYTPIPNSEKENIPKSDSDSNDESKIDLSRKMLLENIDKHNHTHGQAKLAKKHIIEYFQTVNKASFETPNEESVQSKVQVLNTTLIRQLNKTLFDSNKNATNTIHSPYKSFISKLNITASWSEYPFAAVYIYEPMQVHCDAAGINSHWLVASGACLSRVSKKFDVEGLSAFVVYCGELWWQPERVAYVKYSIVHPLYHPQDRKRKHLYNIGAIQVVNSMMTSCAGWAPIPLMSHQFVAEPEGSWAYAVGWGLDRFDTKYGATNLPRTPLMIYKSLVYFNSCPGNVGYSKAKRLAEGGGVSNVHCLSLPPYSGEETDPVHGGLLLVNGKLIALYLQEERRPWGEQSAQYTGIWRLVPWLMDVAKEPDEIDSIIFEI